jgi:hypothetical protein
MQHRAALDSPPQRRLSQRRDRRAISTLLLLRVISARHLTKCRRLHTPTNRFPRSMLQHPHMRRSLRQRLHRCLLPTLELRRFIPPVTPPGRTVATDIPPRLLRTRPRCRRGHPIPHHPAARDIRPRPRRSFLLDRRDASIHLLLSDISSSSRRLRTLHPTARVLPPRILVRYLKLLHHSTRRIQLRT